MISIPRSAVQSAVTQIVNCKGVRAAPIVAKNYDNLLKGRANVSGKKSIPTQAMTVTTGIGGPGQVRFSHSDIKVPDFDNYRKPGNINKNKENTSAVSSRNFSYIIAGAGAAGSVYLGKQIVDSVVMSLSATKDVLAMAKLEVKLSDIPEGKSMVFKWRGKPLFIRNRTEEEIATEKAVNLSELRDPQHDDDRVRNPQWLIVLGICTHLGCVPVSDAGDFGGYYCPCHGSHYDCSGRIRKGPAPLNLDVPYYEFPDDETVIVG